MSCCNFPIIGKTTATSRGTRPLDIVHRDSVSRHPIRSISATLNVTHRGPSYNQPFAQNNDNCRILAINLPFAIMLNRRNMTVEIAMIEKNHECAFNRQCAIKISDLVSAFRNSFSILFVAVLASLAAFQTSVTRRFPTLCRTASKTWSFQAKIRSCHVRWTLSVSPTTVRL
jgi:hypothetical protein